jgi:hypothetical protein
MGEDIIIRPTDVWHFRRRNATATVRRPELVVAIADLNERVRLGQHFRSAGFNVREVASGAEVVVAWSAPTHTPDVLLADADLIDLPAPALLDRLEGLIEPLSCCFLADSLDSPHAHSARLTGAEIIARQASLLLIEGALWEAVGYGVLSRLSKGD